jgi:ribosomal protein RSM22 (predicted rRNA methylase)
MIYPPELERWWLERARRATGHADTRAALDELDPLVSSLSDGFTKARRAGMGGYTADRRAWIAYGLYYFPQTCTRLRLIARELLARGWKPPSQIRALDLGAGTGAAATGLTLAVDRPVRATLLDHSPAALELAREMAEVMQCTGHPMNVETRLGDLRRPPDGEWDVVLSSYALNEALVEATEDERKQWLADATSRLSGGGVLILCEPVVQERGQQMAELRDWAIRDLKLRVLAPCFHEAACPLAARGEWCHDVRTWKVPEAARYLNRHLHRSIGDLKFSFLVLARFAIETRVEGDARHRARIVAPVRWLKGKWQMTGCADDGQLHDYEVLKRGLAAEHRHYLDGLERGDGVVFRGVNAVGNPPVLRARVTG